jgi:hypothetical protein
MSRAVVRVVRSAVNARTDSRRRQTSAHRQHRCSGHVWPRGRLQIIPSGKAGVPADRVDHRTQVAHNDRTSQSERRCARIDRRQPNSIKYDVGCGVVTDDEHHLREISKRYLHLVGEGGEAGCSWSTANRPQAYPLAGIQPAVGCLAEELHGHKHLEHGRGDDNGVAVKRHLARTINSQRAQPTATANPLKRVFDIRHFHANSVTADQHARNASPASRPWGRTHRPDARCSHAAVDAFEPRIRELLAAIPTMPATVIAERVGGSTTAAPARS